MIALASTFGSRDGASVEHRPFALRRFAHAALLATLTAGCSSSGDSQTANSQVLDPTQAHYGQTYAQWSAAWWTWVYQLPETANNCYIPFQDPTGTACATNQSGDVFFLAGTMGGTVVRDACVVPRGEAIFFPIITSTGDNAGLPPGSQFSDMQLQQYVQSAVDSVPLSSLSVEYDGAPITDLARFKTPVTQYSYMLPPEPNVYTCEGLTGVTGLVDPSYEAGYFIMLGPPAPGAHTLHFTALSPGSMSPTMIDVTYHFKVSS
jgi:hypothetical protein